MMHYSGFLDAVKNASLLNLQDFEKYENDTTLESIGDLADLAAKVCVGTGILGDLAAKVRIATGILGNLAAKVCIGTGTSSFQ